LEALQAWTEQVVYELEHLSDAEGARILSGTTALLKVEDGMVCKYIVEDYLEKISMLRLGSVYGVASWQQ
jgi:hypothetical protein